MEYQHPEVAELIVPEVENLWDEEHENGLAQIELNNQVGAQGGQEGLLEQLGALDLGGDEALEEDWEPPFDMTDMNWAAREMPVGSHAEVNPNAYRPPRIRVEKEVIALALELAGEDEQLRLALASPDFEEDLWDRIADLPTLDIPTVHRAIVDEANARGFLGATAQGLGDVAEAMTPEGQLTGPERGAVMAFSMMGQLEWRQPAESQFAGAVVAGTLDALPSGARMNCWESLLFAAYRAGAVTLVQLRQIYTVAGTDDARLRDFLGVNRAQTVWRQGDEATEVEPPPLGALIFVVNGTPLWHVVQSLGNGEDLSDTDVMSLYHLGTGGVFGRLTAGEYTGNPMVDELQVCLTPFQFGG